MKKVFLTAFAVVMALSLPIQGIAAVINTTIKSDKATVEYIHNTDSFSEYKADMMPVINEWIKPENGEYVSTDIELNFTNDGAGVSKVYLGLSADTDEIVNFYSFKVTDADGKVIYDDATANNSAKNRQKEIYITDTSESGVIKLEYRIADGASASLDISSLKLFALSRVEKTVTSKPAPTAKPKFDLDTPSGNDGYVFDINDGTIKDTDSTENNPKSIEKVVGKDIPADRYNVSGNGKLTITSANGMIKYQSVITDDEGVSVVLLEKGDVIKITALDGQEKANLKFSKAASGATAGAVATVKPSKSNPKTDDASMETGMTIAVFALLAGAIITLEVIKRKNSSNN